MLAALIFWTCFSCILLCYVGYPIFLFLAYSFTQLKRDWQYLNRRQNRRQLKFPDNELPQVTVVVAAYNEAERLPAKLANIDEIDYPADKLRFIFVSDGSTDGTTELLVAARRPNVEVIVKAVRGGKPSAVNDGVAKAATDILVLSDASTLFTPDSIRTLVRHFSNPEIGVVCGSLEFRSIETTGGNEGVYWGFESMLRLMEARMGATLTASGAFYAIRRSCYPGLSPQAVLDDILVPMHARSLGFGVAYDPEAVAIEFPASTIEGEYVRRIRLAAGSFRALGKLIRTPMPGFTRIAFLCHKVLRWIVPFLLIGVLLSNLFLTGTVFYRAFLAAQLLFYFWAALGFLLRRQAFRLRYLLLGYFVVAMNFAFLIGFLRFLRSEQRITWERVN